MPLCGCRLHTENWRSHFFPLKKVMEDISFSPEGFCYIPSPIDHIPSPSSNDQTPSPIQADPTTSPHEDEVNNVEVQAGICRLKINGVDKVECKYCKKLIGGKSKNGAKHFWQYNEIFVQYKIFMRRMKGQAFLTPKVVQGKQELGAGTYDEKYARGELVKENIMHEYLLSIVDHLGFRRYSSALQLVFQVPTRNTIKKEIMKIYENERAISLKLLDSLDGRTSTNKEKGYIAIIAHYIDGCCNLQSQLLRFIYVLAPHISDRLCNVLTDYLMDRNIDTKLFIITLDNPMIQQMVKNMMIKFDKYWGVIHNVMGVSIVLNPRYKIELFEYYYEKLYKHDSFNQVRCIQQLCYDLVYDYQMKMNKDSFGSNAGDVTSSEIVGKKRARSSYVKLELDHYLEEEILTRVMQAYPPPPRWHLQSSFFLLHSASIKLQEEKDSIDEEDPRPTSSIWSYIMWYQEHLRLGDNHNLGTNMSHHSSSINGEGTSHKDRLSRILDELSSLKLWKEKLERKEKGKERVKINQDEREEIREEERRKILKELRKEKHASYSSHNSCKSLSEELRDYYEGRQKVYFKILWLSLLSKERSRSRHLRVPSKPKDDKGKTIEKQPPKASMQEKISSIKCFKYLGRGHITSQCPTKKTMIMKGQEIYSSQDEATTSPSSSGSEEVKEEESSEEIYPEEEGQPLMVKEDWRSVRRQPPHFLLCKKTLVSIVTPLGLEFIPQVKELLDEGLVHKSLNPCALLVFIWDTLGLSYFLVGIINMKIQKKVPLIELVRNHVPSWEDAQEMGVEGRSPEFQEPLDLRSNPFQGGGNEAILPPKGIG
ncbi:Zinc finger BED domain-containing protein RICESLEEPER 3 [Glycine soja]